MLRSISSSAISHFLVCPRLYWYKFIEQKTPVGLDSHAEEGRLIHYYLDQHARGLLNTLPAHEPETLRVLWNHYLSYIQAFSKNDCKSEWDFYIPYTLQNASITLTGRIDRLIISDDHLIVLDWKSGRSDSSLIDQNQMAFYAWCLMLMQDSFPQTKVNYIDTRRVYLKDKSEKREVFKCEEIALVKNRFESVIAQMDETKYQFLSNPIQLNEEDNFCSICYFQPICPGGKHLKESMEDCIL